MEMELFFTSSSMEFSNPQNLPPEVVEALKGRSIAGSLSYKFKEMGYPVIITMDVVKKLNEVGWTNRIMYRVIFGNKGIR